MSVQSLRIAAGMCLGWLAVCASGASPVTVDAAFLLAYHGREKQQLSAWVKSHPNNPALPYVLARLIDVDPTSPDLPDGAEELLDKYAGIPGVEKLRADLVINWATQGEWRLYKMHEPRVPDWIKVDNSDLRCAAALFGAAESNKVVINFAATLGAVDRLSPVCAHAMSTGILAGLISNHDAVKAIFSVASVGRAQEVRLTDESVAALRKAMPTQEFDQFTLGMRIIAVSRSDYSAGRDLLRTNATQLGDAMLASVSAHQGAIGVRQSRAFAHDVIVFGNGYEADVSASIADLRCRAALAARSWNYLEAAIRAQPADVQGSDAWRYWLAISRLKLHSDPEALASLKHLATGHGYYALLAADALHVTYARSLASNAPARSTAFLNEKNPAVKRALALYRLGLWLEGARELNLLAKQATRDDLLSGLAFAIEKGLIDRQISFADRADTRDLALRYPQPYEREVVAAARKTAVAEELIFAIAREESRFFPYAISRAGAIGLMQVMPPTARLTRSGRSRVTTTVNDLLLDPEFNIRVGSEVIASLLKRFGPRLAVVIAGYNAGPNRISNWGHGSPHEFDGRIWVETIPIEETREYTRRVLSNFVYYKLARGRAPEELSKLLSMGPG
jgi:soluble lytic murein transglycosylase